MQKKKIRKAICVLTKERYPSQQSSLSPISSRFKTVSPDKGFYPFSPERKKESSSEWG